MEFQIIAVSDDDILVALLLEIYALEAFFYEDNKDLAGSLFDDVPKEVHELLAERARDRPLHDVVLEMIS